MKIVNQDVVQFTIATSQSSATGTVSGFTSASQMVVWGTQRVGGGQGWMDQEDFEVDVYVTNATTITAQRIGTPSTEAVTIRAHVVELDSNTNVYTGTWSMATGDTTDVVNIGGTVVAADAFAWHYRKGSAVSNGSSTDWGPDDGMTRIQRSTTQVTITRNTSGVTIEGHWTVVENSDLFVQQITDTHDADTTPPTASITSVTMADAFVCDSYSSASTDEYNDDGRNNGQLTGQTELSYYYGFGGADSQTHTSFVVEDSDISVQRGLNTSNSSSGTVSITSVTLANSIARHTSDMFCISSTDYQHGRSDGKARELWLSDATTLNWQAGDAIDADTEECWEVVEFQVAAASSRRVMVIS